ncbi:hypothetical protein CHARACLAT_032774 [Characodon lateralis]|uniref:Uncharacterized protein n=1 Tax=Characodon lateralis TaxID=208331 RepID=A0ABU7CX56_9TELE|nr:hypothetical protein [Characodon lateralis]
MVTYAELWLLTKTDRTHKENQVPVEHGLQKKMGPACAEEVKAAVRSELCRKPLTLTFRPLGDPPNKHGEPVIVGGDRLRPTAVRQKPQAVVSLVDGVSEATDPETVPLNTCRHHLHQNPPH